MRGGRKEKGRVVDYLAEIISIYKNIINAKRKENKRRLKNSSSVYPLEGNINTDS